MRRKISRLKRSLERIRRRRLFAGLGIVAILFGMGYVFACGSEPDSVTKARLLPSPGNKREARAEHYAIPSAITRSDLEFAAKELSSVVGRDIPPEKLAQLAREFEGQELTIAEIQGLLPPKIAGKLSQERLKQFLTNRARKLDRASGTPNEQRKKLATEGTGWNFGAGVAMCAAVVGVVVFFQRQAVRPKERRRSGRRSRRHG